MDFYGLIGSFPLESPQVLYQVPFQIVVLV
jgi:hypothetical protein